MAANPSRSRMLPATVLGAALLGAAVVALSACGSAQDTPAQSTPAQSTHAQSTPAQTPTEAPSVPSPTATASSTTAQGPLLPTEDAEATRDKLYTVMRAAPFSDEQDPDTLILETWNTAFPGLKLTLFPFQEADDSQVSSSTAFLISRAAGSYDQWFAFAVKDSKGHCAGGVAVIRGEGHGVSDSRKPNTWGKVAFSGKCSAETVAEHFQPGSVG